MEHAVGSSEVALLQEKTRSLEAEIERRTELEAELLRRERELYVAFDRLAALYRLGERLQSADSLADVYEAAITSMTEALQCDGAAIIELDRAGRQDIVASRNIDQLRFFPIEGRLPWRRDDAKPEPVSYSEISRSGLPRELKQAAETDGIHAAEFVPVVVGGRLCGSFELYYNAAREITAAETALALAIARQFAVGAERMRVEEGRQRWEAERARLAAIVETSEDAIVSKDLNGIVTSWNASAERIYGWKASEIIGRSKGLVIPPDIPDELSNILARIRAGQRIEHYETRRIRKDGVIFHAAISVSPLMDSTGTIVGAATIVRDITAQVMARREIEALNERLKRAMRETHHRVKNNLQVIAAMLDLKVMDSSGHRDVPVEELSRLGSHVRALAAVHDVLTHHLRDEEQEQLLSIRNVFDRLVPLLRQAAGNQAVCATIEDVLLTGKQASGLAIVTNELVGNAVKHGDGPVELCLTAPNSHALLTVRDHGPGFPPGFDPALSANTGLQLVESLVTTDLGGQARFTNHAEGGAVVSISVPIPDGPRV